VAEPTFEFRAPTFTRAMKTLAVTERVEVGVGVEDVLVLGALEVVHHDVGERGEQRLDGDLEQVVVPGPRER
jgi:hypothetical protein